MKRFLRSVRNRVKRKCVSYRIWKNHKKITRAINLLQYSNWLFWFLINPGDSIKYRRKTVWTMMNYRYFCFIDWKDLSKLNIEYPVIIDVNHFVVNWIRSRYLFSISFVIIWLNQLKSEKEDIIIIVTKQSIILLSMLAVSIGQSISIPC